MGMRKNRLILIGIVIFFSSISSAQITADFTAIDQWASKQRLQDTAITALTHKLIAPAKNNLEKLRAIYQFVIHFLSYDHEAAESVHRRINQNTYDILQRKKGTCWDYASLVCAMATTAGIPCYVVSGFSKVDNRPLVVDSVPDHAWNLVYLDTLFYLLDATWESSRVATGANKKQSRDLVYFLPAPEVFITDHYPSLSAFQLLSCPLSWEEFLQDAVQERNTPCTYSFQDTLRQFLGQSFLEQKILEMESVFHMRPNVKNRTGWGHALIDKAIMQKERADVLYEQTDYTAARPIYAEALHYFQQGEEQTTLYPWQKESQAFCYLNYAQVLYRYNHSNGLSLAPVIKQLTRAKSILEKLNSNSFQVQGALGQIERLLKALK